MDPDYTALTDEELFDRWRADRDVRAFAEIDRRHHNELLGCALVWLQGLGVPAADWAADEDVNKTFLRLSLRTRPLPSVRCWLYCVLKNLVRDRGRAHRRLRTVSLQAGDESDSGVPDPEEEDLGPLDELINAETPPVEQIQLIRECLCELLPADFNLIYLHYFEGLSYVEIAANTGVPETALGSRLHRARNKLRACYCRRLGESEGRSPS